MMAPAFGPPIPPPDGKAGALRGHDEVGYAHDGKSWSSQSSSSSPLQDPSPSLSQPWQPENSAFNFSHLSSPQLKSPMTPSPDIKQSNTNQGDQEILDTRTVSVRYRNPFLALALWRTKLDELVQRLLGSEIRRRTVATVVLLALSRVGYFLPLPGFDRRFLQHDILRARVDEFSGMGSELQLSFFCLGLSSHWVASTFMQLLMAFKLSDRLEQLKEEGNQGAKQLERITWMVSMALAALFGLLQAFIYRQHAVYGTVSGWKWYVSTAGLMAFGSMVLEFISSQISQHGFGHGSSLIICMGILSGYVDNLGAMFSNNQHGAAGGVPAVALFVLLFFGTTFSAAFLTSAVRKVPYNSFDLEYQLSARSEGARGRPSSLEAVEQVVPFPIIPDGMAPVLMSSHLLAVAAFLLSLLPKFGWRKLPLSEAAAASGGRIIHQVLQFVLIVIFNQVRLGQNSVKQLGQYLLSVGARIRGVKPGAETLRMLQSAQTSSTFWGGVLLATLTALSSFIDSTFSEIFHGSNIGFTSMLIIVGTIMSLRRAVEAYQQGPRLEGILRKFSN